MLGRSLVSESVNQQEWMEINGWVNYQPWVGTPERARQRAGIEWDC